MKEKRLARIRNSDLFIEDHGWLMWSGEFCYEGGGVQGLGYGAKDDLIKGLMNAVGSRTLAGMNGKSCWVVCESGLVSEVHPLHKEDGMPFIIKEWQEKQKSKK
jgi:hypothetical protein